VRSEEFEVVLRIDAAFGDDWRAAARRASN